VWVLMKESNDQLNTLMNSTADAAVKISMRINTDKTMVQYHRRAVSQCQRGSRVSWGCWWGRLLKDEGSCGLAGSIFETQTHSVDVIMVNPMTYGINSHGSWRQGCFKTFIMTHFRVNIISHWVSKLNYFVSGWYNWCQVFIICYRFR